MAAITQRQSPSSSSPQRRNVSRFASYEGGAGDDGTMLIEDMHYAVTKTQDKIGSLRQALSEKNQVIRRERALRRAAEHRELDKSVEATYVDIYAGSKPSVNEELKDWLSPTKQRDRLLRGGKPHPRETEHRKTARQSPKGIDKVDASKEGNLSDSLRSSDMDVREMEDDEEEDKQTRRSRKSRRKRAHDDDYSPPYPNWNPNMTIPPMHSTPWFNPELAYSIAHNPWVSPHRLSRPPPGYPPPDPSFAHPLSHSVPNLGGFPPPVQRHSDIGQAFAEDHGQGGQRVVAGTKDASNQAASAGPSVQSEPQHTSTPIRVVVDRGTSAKESFEEGVPMLLTELGSMRDINKELKEKLLETEQEIESLTLFQSLTEATLEARVAARAAAVVEEIYAAQKERDEAIMSRLRLANQERDESMGRLRRLENKDGFDSGTDVDDEIASSDLSMDDLLARLSVAETGAEISQYGQSILSQIGRVKSSKGRIVAEEMRIIMQDKDAALAKCKKQEREIIELRRSTHSTDVHGSNKTSLLSQLEATKQERDAALAKARKLQEELDEVRVFYSLHKALSQEADLCNQFNTTIGGMEERVKAKDQVLNQTQQSNSQLGAHVKQLQNERNSLAAHLKKVVQAQRDSQSKAEEQERLISVLRKKVAEGTVKTVN